MFSLFLLIIASFALGPRFLLAGRVSPEALSWAEPLQGLLVIVGLTALGATRGLHPRPRAWPILAVAWMLLQTGMIAAFAELSPPRGFAMILHAGLALSLPWICVLVRFNEGERRAIAFALMSIPSLSVLAGLLLQAAGLWSVYIGHWGSVVRLQGATRADYLAAFAAAAVAVALHEWLRTRDRRIAGLFFVNMAILVFTGGRMGMLASAVWLGTYVTRSLEARRVLIQLRRKALAGGLMVAVAILLYLPSLRYRWAGWSDLSLHLSGREVIWEHYFESFLARPWFGLGLGAAQPGVLNPMLPHMEYLRLLVEGGILGAALYIGAVAIWGREFQRVLGEGDRPFLAATLVTIAIYALTDNPISSSYLSLFLYLGVLARPGTRLSAGSSQ